MKRSEYYDLVVQSQDTTTLTFPTSQASSYVTDVPSNGKGLHCLRLFLFSTLITYLLGLHLYMPKKQSVCSHSPVCMYGGKMSLSILTHRGRYLHFHGGLWKGAGMLEEPPCCCGGDVDDPEESWPLLDEPLPPTDLLPLYSQFSPPGVASVSRMECRCRRLCKVEFGKVLVKK